jgi:hypothetical protein
MNWEPNDNLDTNSFEYKLKQMSDDELVSILRYREEFQPHAVNKAIKEAISRGIISSVEELESDEFKPQQIPPRSLFPLANTFAQNMMILKSLCRIFFGYGIIPILYGVFRFRESNYTLSALAITIGIIILAVAYQLNKTAKQIYAIMMMAVNLPAIAVVVYFLIKKGTPTAMDIVATAVVLLILIYTTLYASKISSFLQRKNNSL